MKVIAKGTFRLFVSGVAIPPLADRAHWLFVNGVPLLPTAREFAPIPSEPA